MGSTRSSRIRTSEQNPKVCYKMRIMQLNRYDLVNLLNSSVGGEDEAVQLYAWLIHLNDDDPYRWVTKEDR